MTLDVTGLYAVPGETQISLEWVAPVDSTIQSYRVYRDGIQIWEGVWGRRAPTEFIDTGLVASTTYSYRVTTLDANMVESPGAFLTTATTDPKPPIFGVFEAAAAASTSTTANYESNASASLAASSQTAVTGNYTGSASDTILASASVDMIATALNFGDVLIQTSAAVSFGEPIRISYGIASPNCTAAWSASGSFLVGATASWAVSAAETTTPNLIYSGNYANILTAADWMVTALVYGWDKVIAPQDAAWQDEPTLNSAWTDITIGQTAWQDEATFDAIWTNIAAGQTAWKKVN